MAAAACDGEESSLFERNQGPQGSKHNNYSPSAISKFGKNFLSSFDKSWMCLWPFNK